MAQVTWRASNELVEKVQNVASAEGVSMNQLLTRVLTLATESDERDPEALRLRERMRAAGMLAGGPAREVRSTPIDPNSLARARAAAGQGIPLSDIVSEQRS